MVKELYVDIKLVIKKIVTNSDFLSSIRRAYRYQTAKFEYLKLSKQYYAEQYSTKLSKLHNTKCGKTCFVIGNGPSLNAEDLDILSNNNIDCFAANRVYLMYEKTKWRPTYYMCQDRQLLQTLKEYYSNCEEDVILGYQAKAEYGIDIPKAFYYLCDNRDCTRLVKSLKFSSDASKYVIDGGSVTYSAIQMAVYMGYSQIYLLGVDHSFSHTLDKNRRVIEHKDVKKDYFDDRYKEAFSKFEEKGKTYAAPDKNMMDLAFKAARNYCDANGITIKNATRGGKLEIFQRIDFDMLFNEGEKVK